MGDHSWSTSDENLRAIRLLCFSETLFSLRCFSSLLAGRCAAPELVIVRHYSPARRKSFGKFFLRFYYGFLWRHFVFEMGKKIKITKFIEPRKCKLEVSKRARMHCSEHEHCTSVTSPESYHKLSFDYGDVTEVSSRELPCFLPICSALVWWLWKFFPPLVSNIIESNFLLPKVN